MPTRTRDRPAIASCGGIRAVGRSRRPVALRALTAAGEGGGEVGVRCAAVGCGDLASWMAGIGVSQTAEGGARRAGPARAARAIRLDCQEGGAFAPDSGVIVPARGAVDWAPPTARVA